MTDTDTHRHHINDHMNNHHHTNLATQDPAGAIVASAVLLESDLENQTDQAAAEKDKDGADVPRKKIGEKDTMKFPEGGKGWWVALGCFFVANTTYGMINTYGVYQIQYQSRFSQTNSSTISLVGSLQATMTYFASVAVIFCHNYLGVKRTVALGGLIQVFSIMMISLCKEMWQTFLVQGVLFGFGGGLTYFTALAIPAEWFKEKRALVMGLIAAGSSLGGLIWPIALQRLIDGVGFAWANRIIGFIFLAEVTISVITIESRLPRTKGQLLPKFSVLKEWRFSLLVISSAVGIFGLFPPIFYISTFAARTPGVSTTVANYILPILNASSIVGRILPGYLGDIIGRLNALIPTIFLSWISIFCFWVPSKHGEGLLVTFSVVWGMASGAYISLFPSCVGQLFGVDDIGSRLTIYGLMLIPGSLTGSSIAGAFIPTIGTTTYGFDKLGIFSAFMFFGSFVGVLILRLSYSKKLMDFV